MFLCVKEINGDLFPKKWETLLEAFMFVLVFRKFLNKAASMHVLLLVFCTDIGVMSGAAIYIKKDLKVSDVEIEVLIGILNLYSLIGSAAAGRTSDWIGRRYTIVLAGAIFFAGALLMGFAPNYAFLMFGRFIAGIGVGYALMIAPVYTAEVSPASSRGFLTSFPEVCFLPTLFNHNLGYYLQESLEYIFLILPKYPFISLLLNLEVVGNFAFWVEGSRSLVGNFLDYVTSTFIS